MNSPYKVKHVYPHGPAIKSCDCWWGNIEYEEIDSGEQQCSSEFFLQIFYFFVVQVQRDERVQIPVPLPNGNRNHPRQKRANRTFPSP